MVHQIKHQFQIKEDPVKPIKQYKEKVVNTFYMDMTPDNDQVCGVSLAIVKGCVAD